MRKVFLMTIAVGVLFFTPLAAFTQEKPAQKVCLFTHVNMSTGEEAEAYRSALTDAINTELLSNGFQVVLENQYRQFQTVRNYSDADILNGYNAVVTARDLEADVAITGFIRIEETRILFSIKAYDVLTGRLKITLLKEGRSGLGLYNLIDETSSELIARIQQEIEVYAEETKTIQRELTSLALAFEDDIVDLGVQVPVTVYSENEGMELFYTDGVYAGTIVDGKAVVPAQAHSTLVLEKRLPEHHPGKEYIEITGFQPLEKDLSTLKPKTKDALELTYTTFQMIGAGVGYRWYLTPDWFFLRGRYYFFMDFPFLQSSAAPIMHHDFNANIGHYLFLDPNSVFRLALTSGLGVTTTSFSTVDDTSWYFFDFYWEYFSIYMELNLTDFAFYYESSLRYNFETGTNLRGIGTASSPLGGTYMSLGVILK